MNLLLSIAFAAGVSIVIYFALREVFKSLDPAKISDYRACKGGWWEGELNQCAQGLLLVPQQPVNTYTNLAYAAAGSFLIFNLNTLPAYVLFLTLLYLCAGSALYHATSTRWGGSLDVSGIYAVISALGAYALFTLVGLEDLPVAFIMFVFAALIGYLWRYKYKGDMRVKIGILLLVVYAFVIWNMLKKHISLADGFLIASLVLFLLGFIAWNLDKWRVFPLKRWGHGLWHLLTAAAFGILFYVIHLTR
jgi:predicted membrane channel-forming protein YqfA (hemolysin III family)